MKKNAIMSSKDHARSAKDAGLIPERHTALSGADQIYVQYGDLELFVVDGRGCVLGRPSVCVAIDRSARLIFGMHPIMGRRQS